MFTKIQLRRDTAVNWTLINPVLSQGEAGYDLTNKILKIGDGTTTWNNLSPLTGGGGGGGSTALSSLTDVNINNPANGQVLKYNGTQWVNGVDNTGGGGGGGTVTSVNISGGTTGLTSIGGPVTTSGTITLGGILSVANGGTGLTTTPLEGAIDIGNGTGFTRTRLTAGTGISIANGPRSITISATGGGGGGGTVSMVYRTLTSNNANIILTAFGSQSDIDSADINFINGNTVTISNIGSLKLYACTTTYAAGINTSPTFNYVYPEINGQTSINFTNFPTLAYYNNATPSVIQGNTSWNVSNSNGIVTVQRTGLTGNPAANWKIIF